MAVLMQKTPRLRRLAPLLGLVLWLLVVACANLVPQNGWDQGAGPVVPHDSFPADCSLCHTGGNWQTIRADFTFDHGARTGVVLQGAHAKASCLLCHNDRGPVQQFAARGCAGCHADPHLTRLGANCQDCHEERSWYPREAILVHDRTRFPLVGAHAAAACFRCHPGAQVGNFAGAPVRCEQCHEADYQRTANPNHALASFPRDCEQCHLPVAWSSARFDHPASFPLSFGHAGRRCGECHTTPNAFTGLSTACASCHLDDYQATANPNHAAAGFGTDCADCHNTLAWRGAGFAHPASFPLSNAHQQACTACHTGGVFTGLSTACASCHLQDYQTATDPPHASFGLSQQCEQCHTPTIWGDGNWNHQFPITSGRHSGFACFDCHTNPGNRQAFSCIDCHEHNQTSTNQDHQGVSGYTWTTAGCYQCHPDGRN
jgi:hypothetical protein